MTQGTCHSSALDMPQWTLAVSSLCSCKPHGEKMPVGRQGFHGGLCRGPDSNPVPPIWVCCAPDHFSALSLQGTCRAPVSCEQYQDQPPVSLKVLIPLGDKANYGKVLYVGFKPPLITPTQHPCLSQGTDHSSERNTPTSQPKKDQAGHPLRRGQYRVWSCARVTNQVEQNISRPRRKPCCLPHLP